MTQDNWNPARAQRPICVIGNANLDIVLGHLDAWPDRGTEAFFPHSDLRIGGSAANTALVLQRLGSTFGFVTTYGTDLAGDVIGERFTGPLDRLQRLAKPTSYTVGILHPDSERTFLSSAGHLDHTDLSTFRALLADWPLEDALVLISGAFTMPAFTADQAALQEWLRERGARVALDPGWPPGCWTEDERAVMRAWIERCDHLLVNDKEACAFTGLDDVAEAAHALSAAMPPEATVIVKMGPEGALAVRADEIVRCEARPLDLIDTVGAGDSFNAGYLDAVARGMPLRPSLERAIAIAGKVLSQFPRTHEPIAIDPAD